MGSMVYSLLWVMQDVYSQPYEGSLKAYSRGTRTASARTWGWPSVFIHYISIWELYRMELFIYRGLVLIGFWGILH